MFLMSFPLLFRRLFHNLEGRPSSLRSSVAVSLFLSTLFCVLQQYQNQTTFCQATRRCGAFSLSMRTFSRMKIALLLSVALTFSNRAEAVDRTKFRKCSDTGFCRSFRNAPTTPVQYSLDLDSVKETGGQLIGKVSVPSAASVESSKQLNLRVSVLASGSVRLKISEEKERWQPLDVLLPTGITLGSYKVLQTGDASIPATVHDAVQRKTALAIAFGSPATTAVLVIHASPLKFELYQGGVLQVSANERSLMHYEQSRETSTDDKSDQSGKEKVDRHGGKEVVDYGEDGLATYADGTKEEKKALEHDEHHHADHDHAHDHEDFSESFNGHTDTRPRGPRSVGLDFSFPFAQHVYGLPEHTSPLSLPTTAQGTGATASPHYTEPYRLYNLDVFEYELDQTMALYGHIPLLLAHGLVNGKGRTTGVFWFNPSETFVDIADGGSAGAPYKQSHWLSESGEIDFFLLPGPSPAAVYAQYTRLTGRQQLPPLFALGYHQCRWNYRDEKDVATVEGMFEKLDYPVDVIWLDIEHTDGKRYFTWDKNVFPNPIEMQQNVSRHGRKMVTIVDPHIKRDDGYYVHKEATAKGLYVKDKDGNDFDGWCWPGQSSYLDFTSPNVRQWWAEQFSLSRYQGSTLDLFTWNDMNEPSVFNGPEVSMQKDALNLDKVEHREWHNMYGYYMQQATALGLTLRSPPASAATPHPLRPFVLTRAFWAGSQRFGAMWTGDNTAEWGHLKIAAPMLLSINLAGLSFAGADVGGFFGEPGPELFTRWYQAAAFTPFFRGHAHHDTKRREPWVLGDPYTNILRDDAMTRYSLLPLWYSVFYEAYSTGMPVMRTMFSEFPDDVSTFAMDDQWMVGSALLVKPASEAGQTSVDVYLPACAATGTDGWYDLHTLAHTAPSGPGQAVKIDAPLGKIPVFIRSGKIIPRKMRLRRSSKLMYYDPLTLVVAPSKSTGSAEGLLYLDDEHSLAHELAGHYVHRRFRFQNNVFYCEQAPVSEDGTGEKKDVAASAVVTGAGQVIPSSGTYRPPNTVERIEIAGQARGPKRVVLKQDKVDGETELEAFYDPTRQVITIKKPDCNVADNWSITLQM